MSPLRRGFATGTLSSLTCIGLTPSALSPSLEPTQLSPLQQTPLSTMDSTVDCGCAAINEAQANTNADVAEKVNQLTMRADRTDATAQAANETVHAPPAP